MGSIMDNNSSISFREWQGDIKNLNDHHVSHENHYLWCFVDWTGTYRDGNHGMLHVSNSYTLSYWY